jgi:hypothetical protein
LNLGDLERHNHSPISAPIGEELVFQSRGHHVETEPEFRDACCVVDVLADRTEAIQLIEPARDGIRFKDVEFEV